MPTDKEIRDLIHRRAFEISRQRSAEEGDELSDWLRAEAEVLAEIRAAENEPATNTEGASPARPAAQSATGE